MRFVVWTGVEEWLTEAARVNLDEDGLSVSGRQLGVDPVPYGVSYHLGTGHDLITHRLLVSAVGDGWNRVRTMERDDSGIWRGSVHDDGPVPGGQLDPELPDLAGVLDIDIQYSPMTNTMPILREGFMRHGSGEFTMAFIHVPSLRVEVSRQRYEHVRTTDNGAVVRYISLDDDFSADLELDSDGLVISYPRLARRVEPGEGPAPAD
jgi:uncharacterized protein